MLLKKVVESKKNIMKKLVAIVFLGLSLAFSGTVSAQKNIAKLLPIGAMIQTAHAGGSTSTNSLYQFGVGFERVFGVKTSGQLDIGGAFTSAARGGAMGYLKPAFKYYLLADAPHGLSIGAYVPLAFSSNAIIVGFGPQVGYQMFFLSDKLAVGADFGLGFGYTKWTGGAGGAAGANININVGAGYAF